MNPISCMTSNYVARPANYRMEGGWPRAIPANNEHFRDLGRFRQDFGAILADIRALGFEAVDIWTAHLNWEWATEAHIATARELLEANRLRVTSLAGSFGRTRDHVTSACRLANALGAPLLSGMTYLLATDRAGLAALLREHGLRLAFENHPEKQPADLLRKITGAPDVIGVAIDTGWFATQGCPAPQAIMELREHLFHIHLKDIRAVGQHDTCGYGQGIVGVEACVDRLQQIGYSGPISLEHEPFDSDPGEDCRNSLGLLRGWLGRPSL
ncbi:MAG: hypothetical protein OHK0022_11960 [Roseiflexaceae bacterium]